MQGTPHSRQAMGITLENRSGFFRQPLYCFGIDILKRFRIAVKVNAGLMSRISSG
jgi:hypothetical protein